tara:strand:+ start:322 stop:2001 length:1680 start_codon:yes stop_codon:yes gene_type:complete
MPKIPLFKQQSRISDDTPGVIYDASPELSAISSIANELTGGLGNLSKGIEQGIEKYEKLKDDASVADATRRLVDFENDLLMQKQEALKDPNIGYRNYEEKVLQPSINKFRESLLRSNYSSRVMPRIMQSADIEFGNMIRAERVDRVAKATEENIAVLSKAADQLLLTEDKYEEGVKQYNEMVENGYITTVTRDKSISEANKTYFNNVTKNITSQQQIENLRNNPRFLSMSETDQTTIESEAITTFEKYYTETISTNYELAKDMLKEGRLTPDKIKALDITEEQEEFLIQAQKRRIDDLKEAALLKDDMPRGVKNVLNNIDNRIEKLFLGKVRNPQKELESIYNDLVQPGMPHELITDYLEVIIDRMKTPEGFDVFALNKGNKSVYSREDAWAWEMYWKTYDDATTLLPQNRIKRDMITRQKEFMNFLKTAKKQEPTKYKTERKNIYSKSGYEKAQEELEKSGGRLLTVDSNNNIIQNHSNEMIVNDYINTQFSDYLNVKTEINFNKSFAIDTPLYNQTIFDKYYLAPNLEENDPGLLRKSSRDIGLEKELQRQGILPQG